MSFHSQGRRDADCVHVPKNQEECKTYIYIYIYIWKSHYTLLLNMVSVWSFRNPHLSLMTDNVLLSFEGLCAGVTGKKPLITVDMLFMDFQVAAVSEGLQAGLTAIDHICFNSMVRACTRQQGHVRDISGTDVV